MPFKRTLFPRRMDDGSWSRRFYEWSEPVFVPESHAARAIPEGLAYIDERAVEAGRAVKCVVVVRRAVAMPARYREALALDL